MNTVLKWVGSKSRIMAELKKHLPAGRRLVEPFAGSCSVMMNTDYPEYLIADINPDLINMYRQIKEFPQQFIIIATQVFASNLSEDYYYAIRKEFNEHIGLPLLERAVYFLYLNRNGYRGMCRYNRKGDFNIPYGNYKKPYFPLEEIKAFSEKAQRATFICADFTETLEMVDVGDVVYSDSPYQGTFSDYHAGGFNDDQQHMLAAMLSVIAKRVPVIVSNSDTTLVKSLYCGFHITRINAPRSIGVAAGEKKSAAEIIAKALPGDYLADGRFVADRELSVATLAMGGSPSGRCLIGCDLALGRDTSVVLKVCTGCGQPGGGCCPDCGPCCGDATYNAMVDAGSFDAGMPY